jgi:anti-sigma factor RsiW
MPNQTPDSQHRILQVSDADLATYVQGGLTSARRAEIEGFLACNPDLAAQVMQALHGQQHLQQSTSKPRTARALRLPQVIAACLTCAIAGWAFAEGTDDDGPFRDLSPTPEYVDEAVMSQQASRLRYTMASQVETPAVDPAEIERRMQIRLPRLPAGWNLLDAQGFPSDDGPSVSLLLEIAPGRTVSLFAVRASTSATSTPVMSNAKGASSAYWELGGAAYVLTGDDTREQLLANATLLSHSTAHP